MALSTCGIHGGEYPELSQGSTKNLMDYGGGSILRKYQWDLIHHPRLIIPWLQGDDEGKYYARDGGDIWAGNFNKIACAKSKGENIVELEDIVPDLNVPNMSFNDIGGIAVEIPGMALNSSSKIDISSQRVVEKPNKYDIVYSIVGSEHNLYISVPKTQLDNFLNMLDGGQTYFDGLAKGPPKEESQNAYSQLSRLSTCGYYAIGTGDRLKYLEWLAGEWKNNEDQEEMILDLITYTDDLKGLYTWLQGNPKVLAELMLGCDGDRRAQFINQITKICDVSWPVDPASYGNVYVGMVPSSYGAFYSGNDFLTFAKLKDGSTDCEVLSYIGRFPKGPFDWGNVQNLKTLSQFDCNLLDPVTVYSTEGDIGTMPLIYAVNLSHQAGTSAVGDQFAATLNYIGVASSVSILAKGAGALQKTLALIELSKTGLDMIFNDAEVIAALNQTEDGKQFLKYWQIASVTIDLATIGTDVISGLIEHGAKASKAARAAGKTDAADNIDDLVNEARKIAAQANIPSSLATKLGDQVSNLNDWLVKYANELPANIKSILDDLAGNIGNKRVLDVVEDSQGRFLIQLEGDNRNTVYALLKNKDGQYISYNGCSIFPILINHSPIVF